jgi:NAD(P)-dependent dehydrogenase (short-subunit alcohol dehydrogenase family)
MRQWQWRTIESFTRALANELGPCGVRVNALAPGSVRTPTFESTFLDLMTAEQRTDYDDYVARSYPLGRIGRPDDVAAAATYLASYEASWITGVVLPVDGGFTVR